MLLIYYTMWYNISLTLGGAGAQRHCHLTAESAWAAAPQPRSSGQVPVLAEIGEGWRRMRDRDGRSSGKGRRGRRLTLAPVTRRALQPSPMTAESSEGSDDDDERRCAEGRAALCRAVAMVTAACQHPKPVHRVEIVDTIPSKF
jgi:hypothetical protein